jgi:hypothetical protein
VHADAEQGVIVLLDAAALGAATAPLSERLRVSLERLPIKTRLAAVPSRESEPSIKL